MLSWVSFAIRNIALIYVDVSSDDTILLFINILIITLQKSVQQFRPMVTFPQLNIQLETFKIFIIFRYSFTYSANPRNQ